MVRDNFRENVCPVCVPGSTIFNTPLLFTRSRCYYALWRLRLQW